MQVDHTASQLVRACVTVRTDGLRPREHIVTPLRACVCVCVWACQDGWTPLYIAAFCGHVELMKLLLGAAS